MPETIVVTIAYDRAARVWYTSECAALPGLIYEARTVEALVDELPKLAKALLEYGCVDPSARDIPIEVRLHTTAHLGAAVWVARPGLNVRLRGILEANGCRREGSANGGERWLDRNGNPFIVPKRIASRLTARRILEIAGIDANAVADLMDWKGLAEGGRPMLGLTVFLIAGAVSACLIELGAPVWVAVVADVFVMWRFDHVISERKNKKEPLSVN
jgi:hypothetical protein